MEKLPQEIEVWYIIPAIRREFAEVMVKMGLSQREVADRLGITKPAVSQYINSKRGNDLKFNKTIKDAIKRSVNKILKDDKPCTVIREMQELCKLIRKNMCLCEVSKNRADAPKNCKECFI